MNNKVGKGQREKSFRRPWARALDLYCERISREN